jgi:hypothetical protein
MGSAVSRAPAVQPKALFGSGGAATASEFYAFSVNVRPRP